MSARSPSSKRLVLGLILASAIAPRCFADGVQPADPLLRYRTIDGMQGMYEVREEARKFLARQPAPAEGPWVASLPDVRTFVPTCAVPFRTRWAAASDRGAGGRGVTVACPKSTDKAYKKWSVFVGASAKGAK